MKVVLNNSREVNLPDFFIVGAPKSGTTSLHYYLQGHHQIFMPMEKEPWFFSFMNNKPIFNSPNKFPGIIHKIDDYIDLYQSASADQLCGDASPSYLYTHKEAIINFKRVYQKTAQYRQLKFIISLRNPIDRAWSQYWTFNRINQDPADFMDAIKPQIIKDRLQNKWQPFYDYIGFGMYYDQVKTYLDEFGEKRLKVFLFDDLINDAQKVCHDIFDFLGIESDYSPNTEKIYNPSGKPKNVFIIKFILSSNLLKSAFKKMIPKQTRQKMKHAVASKLLTRVEMPEESRRLLRKQFEPEIRKLEDLIERDLSIWLSTD